MPSIKNMGANQNFNRTIQASRGKYLAFCEGDDYWLSSDKLSKQVDVFEKNPDCSICFHNVLVQYEGGEFTPYPYYLSDKTLGPIGIHDDKPPDITTVSRLLRGNYIQKPSIMMRHVFPDGLPSWLVGLPLGDWPLNVFVARNGSMVYLDEILAVYRIHRGGVWSCVGTDQRSDEAIKAAYAIRENVALSSSEQIILNTYICNMQIYGAQRLLHAGDCRGALRRVLYLFSAEGNRHLEFVLAFVLMVSRRLLPRRLFDSLFSLRRKILCRK